MSASDVFYVLAFIGVAWGIVSMINIVSFLSARGVKINWFLIKIMIIKYVSQYEEMTKKETGKAGWWFYSYVISMNFAAGMAIVGIILSKL
ncbi:MAG: hypothetical protein L0213_05810 [Candidatus Dadabacteria bacterium]|nr:hypothetical protein [Candidatus Dadabacteria bacterium]